MEAREDWNTMEQRDPETRHSRAAGVSTLKTGTSPKSLWGQCGCKAAIEFLATRPLFPGLRNAEGVKTQQELQPK